MLSIDEVMPACPACYGERTSMTSRREIYCVDCNRIYPIPEPKTDVVEGRTRGEGTIRKAA
jgi:hypothetical protein